MSTADIKFFFFFVPKLLLYHTLLLLSTSYMTQITTTRQSHVCLRWSLLTCTVVIFICYLLQCMLSIASYIDYILKLFTNVTKATQLCLDLFLRLNYLLRTCSKHKTSRNSGRTLCVSRVFAHQQKFWNAFSCNCQIKEKIQFVSNFCSVPCSDFSIRC